MLFARSSAPGSGNNHELKLKFSRPDGHSNRRTCAQEPIGCNGNRRKPAFIADHLLSKPELAGGRLLPNGATSNLNRYGSVDATRTFYRLRTANSPNADQFNDETLWLLPEVGQKAEAERGGSERIGKGHVLI